MLEQGSADVIGFEFNMMDSGNADCPIVDYIGWEDSQMLALEDHVQHPYITNNATTILFKILNPSTPSFFNIVVQVVAEGGATYQSPSFDVHIQCSFSSAQVTAGAVTLNQEAFVQDIGSTQQVSFVFDDFQSSSSACPIEYRKSSLSSDVSTLVAVPQFPEVATPVAGTSQYEFILNQPYTEQNITFYIHANATGGAFASILVSFNTTCGPLSTTV